MTNPTPELDPAKLYAIKFTQSANLFLVYPTGAVRFVGPGEWAALDDKVPLVDGGNSASHLTAIEQEAWTSRGYVREPGQ